MQALPWKTTLMQAKPMQALPTQHSDLNDQNLFHSTIDASPGVPAVSKNPDDQTEVHSVELER